MWQAIKALLGGSSSYLILGAAVASGLAVHWLDTTIHESALNKQKAEASQLLAKANASMVEQIVENTKERAEADAKAYEQQRIIEDAHDANSSLALRLSGALERMQQPGRGNGGADAAGTMPAAARDCSALQSTVTKLSGALGRIVAEGTELARSADREAAVAGTAHEWAGIEMDKR